MCSLLSLYTNYTFLVIHNNKVMKKLFVSHCYFLLLVDMCHCFYHTEATYCTETIRDVVQSSSEIAANSLEVVLKEINSTVYKHTGNMLWYDLDYESFTGLVGRSTSSYCCSKTRIISIYRRSQGKVTRGNNSLISNENYNVDCGRDAIIWSASHHIHNLCTCIL